MEFSATDWVTVALTEATLSREGPPLFVAAQRGCVAAAKVMCEAGSNLEVFGPKHEILLAVGADITLARLDGMTARHIAQLPGTPAGLRELLSLGDEAIIGLEELSADGELLIR